MVDRWSQSLGLFMKGIEPLGFLRTRLAGADSWNAAGLCSGVWSRFSLDHWATGLILTRLLDVTHGQWLYRNVQVHDSKTGELATKKKEEIQMTIEKQQDLGEDGLLQEDQFLMEVNLEDLEFTSGERQEYWLLAIRAARVASTE